MTRKFALQRVLELKEQIEDLLQTQVAGIEGERLELQSRIDTLRSQWLATSQNETSPTTPRVPLSRLWLHERSMYEHLGTPSWRAIDRLNGTLGVVGGCFVLRGSEPLAAQRIDA